MKNPTYRNQAEVTNQVAKYDLKKLADEGLLIPKGEKKARHYYAGKRLQEIREQTRRQKERPRELPGFAPKAS